MKILVTGKNGQISLSLQSLSGGEIDVVALGRPELDITDKACVIRVLDEVKPDIVVNAAAFTDVERAEDDVNAAFKTNRDGAANVAQATAACGMPLIHISTDYVFNGTKESPYLESDAVGALSVYGLSKLAGEWAVAKANPAHVILRTAWIYSPYGRNFVKTMLHLAKTKEEISVVDDQWGNPTSAMLVARAIMAVCQKILFHPQPFHWGIFHLTAGDRTNFAAFAHEIFNLAKQQTKQKYPVIRAISSQNYPSKVRRPKFSYLANKKFESSFDMTLPRWDDLLRDELSQSCYYSECT